MKKLLFLILVFGLPGLSFLLFPMACANRSLPISGPVPVPTSTVTPSCYSPTTFMNVSVPPQNTHYPQRYVLRTVSDWDAYCTAVGASPIPPPPVDFNTKMILTFTELVPVSGCGGFGNSGSSAVSLICQGPETITVQETDIAYSGPMNPCDPAIGTPIPTPAPVIVGYSIAINHSDLPVEFVAWPYCVGLYCGQRYILPGPTPTPAPTIVVVP